MAEGGMACRSDRPPTPLPTDWCMAAAPALHGCCTRRAKPLHGWCRHPAQNLTRHDGRQSGRPREAKRPKWRVRKGFPHGGVSSPTAKIPPKPSPYFTISLAFFRENACIFRPISLSLQISHPLYPFTSLYIYLT